MGTDVMTFLGLAIEYDEHVLAPRSWTELQSRWAVEILADSGGGPVLELCSGAGHIGLAVASLADRELVCVDVAEAACHWARHNAERAGIAARVEARRARLEDALEAGEEFVLAIADPPWVASDDVATLVEDPVLAIDGGDDGLVVARACVSACEGHLPTGASLLLQVGSHQQVDVVCDEASARGWREHGRREAGPTPSSGGGVVVRLLHP